MIDPSNTSPDVVERLTRMETKLDLWKESINYQMGDSTKDLLDHETRIRAVEAQVAGQAGISKWKATTGIALLLGLASLIPWVYSLIG